MQNESLFLLRLREIHFYIFSLSEKKIYASNVFFYSLKYKREVGVFRIYTLGCVATFLLEQACQYFGVVMLSLMSEPCLLI